MLTYLADYDDLSRFKQKQKIFWLQRRINRVFVQPVNILLKSVDNTPIPLVIMTQLCCAIEALGHFLRGRINGGSEDDFKLFIDEYIPEASSIKCELYDYFRCGLAHAFVIERGSIDGKVNTLFKRIDRNESYYEVNPWKLFRLFKKGMTNYFKDLKKSSHLRNKFEKRFDHYYKFWIQNPPVSRKD